MNESLQLPEIPGYRLTRPVGSGGAATVYQAIQRSLERQVAVKVFNLPDVETAARLEPLLRTNARLSHPHVLGVHQIGHAAGGRLFHSMPFLTSLQLSAPTLQGKPLRIAALLREILDAVGHAHRYGIVHGGIKPTNVLMDEYGHARVADFGIARVAAHIGFVHPAAADYQSPEQARGQPPGQRSDLYSIGVLAYQLLTGSLPFEGENAVATAVAHIEQPVPRLPPRVAAWQAWIDRALAKTPEQRFQNAREMADALSAIDGQGEATPLPQGASGARVPARAIAVATAAVAAVALAGWAAWNHHRASWNSLDPVPVVQPAVARSSTPASPSTTPASPAIAPLAQRVQALVTQADAARAADRLFSPRGSNAAELYLTVLMLQPGNQDAVTGIDAMLATLRHRLDQAWLGDKLDDINLLVKRCDLLAAHAGSLASRGWRTQRNALAQRVGVAVADAANARDRQRLAQLKPLADSLPAVYPAGFSLAIAEKRVATPVAGDRLRDRNGPPLVYVPASGGTPAFAIARTEMTRADYARFVHATHRRSSRCLEAYNPFSRMRHLTWQAPGFAQDGDHPVVCVSWDDAVAYAAWLSQITGQPYRLPTKDEWRRAAQGVPGQKNPCQLGNVDDVSRNSAMDNDRLSCNDGAAATAPVGGYAPSGVGAYDMYGNVSEWLAGGNARARVFRGLSWRDGSRQTPLGREGTVDSDVGYTNIGFRLVRAIDPAHAAPPPASGD